MLRGDAGMVWEGFWVHGKMWELQAISAAQPNPAQTAMPAPRNSCSSSQKLPGKGVPAMQERSRHKDFSLLLFLIILRVTTMERIFKFGHFLVPIYNACLLLAHYLVWTQQTKHSAAVSCSPLLAQGCCTWLAKALWKCLNLNKKTVFISN